jgi:hypothetical protein
MPDVVLINAKDSITGMPIALVWRQDASTKDWYNFYVVAPGKRYKRAWSTPQRKYYGGWNGERVARVADMALLYQRHPQIYNWMVSVLKEIAA